MPGLPQETAHLCQAAAASPLHNTVQTDSAGPETYGHTSTWQRSAVNERLHQQHDGLAPIL